MKSIIYEVIEKGDGTFFPRVRNINTGMTYGAWDGYCPTKEKAILQLKEKYARDIKEQQDREEKVVFTL